MAMPEAAAAASETFTPPSIAFHSVPWHSPVPYLFGGLAAMLGLIAFALLILACSYWKLSGQPEDAQDVEERGGGDAKEVATGKAAFIDDRVLVIMAGEVKPTFLATPAWIKKEDEHQIEMNSQENRTTIEESPAESIP